MEESISLLSKLKETFQCTEVDIKTYSPLTLAYIGDSIYDLVIRTIVVERGNRAPNGLHKSTSKIVNAGTQARMIEALTELLTEEELTVYKRGRNAKSYTSAKNATIGDYRKATGFESLMGFLYLTDQMDRAIELVQQGLKRVSMEI